MRVSDFKEEIEDELDGQGSYTDTMLVMVKLADGTCLQVKSVELNDFGLYINTENW